MLRFYGVLDADGVKINRITADLDVLGPDWYPGYGAYLVDEGEVPREPEPPSPSKRPDTWGKVLPQPAEPLANGDTLDVVTLKVTAAPSPVQIDAIAEPMVRAI